MTEITLTTNAEEKPLRMGLTFLMCVILWITVVFNGMAGTATSPFINSPGNVSDRFAICIVPAGYTFSIWGLIYTLLIIQAIYAVTILFRYIGATPVWQLGGMISQTFLISLSINLGLNIAWLFVWDREQIIASSVLLFLMLITSNIAIVSALISFRKVAPTFYAISKFDFWANIILLNGYNIYDLWLFLAAQLNLFMAISDQTESSDEGTLCIICLSLIIVGFIGYFIVEHTYLLHLGNPLISHYIVYLWAFIGIYAKNKDFANEHVVNLIIANIFLASFMLAARAISLFFINKNNRFYKSVD